MTVWKKHERNRSSGKREKRKIRRSDQNRQKTIEKTPERRGDRLWKAKVALRAGGLALDQRILVVFDMLHGNSISDVKTLWCKRLVVTFFKKNVWRRRRKRLWRRWWLRWGGGRGQNKFHWKLPLPAGLSFHDFQHYSGSLWQEGQGQWIFWAQ